MKPAHGRRLDALWKIASNPTLGEPARVAAILTLATVMLRPGHPFGARLEYLDEGEAVVEAATPWVGDAGVAFTVPIQAGETRYTLTFGSPQPLAGPLDDEDRTFLELTANTLGERLAKRSMSARIQANAESRLLAQGCRPVSVSVA